MYKIGDRVKIINYPFVQYMKCNKGIVITIIPPLNMNSMREHYEIKLDSGVIFWAESHWLRIDDEDHIKKLIEEEIDD